ncbi:hypothetical protein LSAT2_002343 [Lamellibrachia satsuma]|nr:hypothetical protein LSAT2_002343 [Lamellibrachia satsuma]
MRTMRAVVRTNTDRRHPIAIPLTGWEELFRGKDKGETTVVDVSPCQPVWCRYVATCVPPRHRARVGTFRDGRLPWKHDESGDSRNSHRQDPSP